MTEKIEIWLPKATNTASCGASLTASLYTVPLTLFLKGELGMGKTTFLQGFAQGLGIKERLTSPTYALEQRYRIPSENTPPDGRGHRGGGKMENNIHEPHTPPPLSSPYGGGAPVRRGRKELLHIDLYRIDPKEARELVESSADFEGIRCIEWSEKIPEDDKRGPHIDISLKENTMSPRARRGVMVRPAHHDIDRCRKLQISFHDISLPSQKQILTWRKDVALPSATCHHCDIVGKFAEKVAHSILKNGTIVRPLALRRAGELHDLLRFLDFNLGGVSFVRPTPQEQTCWDTWKERYPKLKHEPACSLFLQERGFDAIATIIEPHGLRLPSPERATIEQKVLFYADKRVIDRVVTIDERFEDFKNRYGNGKISAKHTQWYEEVKAIEKELFPEGVPLSLSL